MGGLQRSPADSCFQGAQYTETPADIVAALAAFAECSTRLESEPLKREVGLATQQLLQHVAGGCKKMVSALVESLRQPSVDSVTYDKLWALRHVGKQSEITRQWMIEDGGVRAIASAMAAHPAHTLLLEEGAWLLYVLRGVDGFVETLELAKGMPQDTPGTMAVQQAIAWVVFELVKTQESRGQAGASEWTQCGQICCQLLAAMCQHARPTLELLRGCCCALKKLIKDQPSQGMLFLQQGGGEALLSAIRMGQTLGDSGQNSLQVVAMWLIAALVEGNSSAAIEFRSIGALDCVVNCGLSHPGAWEDTMWTLGQVGGPLAIVQVMTRSQCPDTGALSAGIRVLSKLTWEPVEESLQQQFPKVVKELINTLRFVDKRLPAELIYVVHALGGALKVCVPQTLPGIVPDVDEGVTLLLQAMRSQRPDVSKAACTCIGHIATSASSWREPLQAALPYLQARWSEAGDTKEGCDDLRDLMWAAGAIAGLPALLDAMRQRPDSSGLQLASMLAIQDVLESDDIWCPGPGSSPSSAGPSFGQPVEGIRLVAAAMSKHRAVLNLQTHGCSALSVLCDALPHNTPIPQEAPAAVLAALRRFPCKFAVASSVCGALRRMLEPRANSEDPLGAVAHTVAYLRSLENPVNDLNKLLQDFPRSDPPLLEDCLFVYSLLAGVPSVLEVVAEKDSTLPKRLAGIKVLVELCRSFRDLLAPHAEAIARAVGMVTEQVNNSNVTVPGREGEVSAEVIELRGGCELLLGLLSHSKA